MKIKKLIVSATILGLLNILTISTTVKTPIYKRIGLVVELDNLSMKLDSINYKLDSLTNENDSIFNSGL